MLRTKLHLFNQTVSVVCNLIRVIRIQVVSSVSLQCLLHLKGSDNESNEDDPTREKRPFNKYNYARIVRQKESVAMA